MNKQTNLDTRYIDIGAAFSNEPPMMDFVLPGFLAGTVGILASPGAAGKTWLALELCCAVASPKANHHLFGMRLSNFGQAVFLSAEDPEIALQSRLYAIAKHLDDDARAEVQANLKIASLVGLPTDLDPRRNRETDPEPEDWSKTICTQCAGARLIILDTLSRWHTRDENANSEMSLIIKKAEFVAKATGASVLFLHHANKGMIMAGRGDEQQSVRGASALVDNARWQATLVGMSKDEAKEHGLAGQPGERERHRRFVVTKQNHGVTFEPVWLRRGDGGVLLRADLQEGTPASTTKATRGRGFNGQM